MHEISLFDVRPSAERASVLDKYFTAMDLESPMDIVHAHTTANELKATFPQLNFQVNEANVLKPTAGRSSNCTTACTTSFSLIPILTLQPKKKSWVSASMFLFFGFIRKYKGLHNVIPAFAKGVPSGMTYPYSCR